MYTNFMLINHESTLTFGKCKVNCLQKNTDPITYKNTAYKQLFTNCHKRYYYIASLTHTRRLSISDFPWGGPGWVS